MHDIHHKIIDDGRKAYLSRHKLGASECSIRWIDCTRVQRDLEHVTEEVLGEYKRDMHTHAHTHEHIHAPYSYMYVACWLSCMFAKKVTVGSDLPPNSMLVLPMEQKNCISE